MLPERHKASGDVQKEKEKEKAHLWVDVRCNDHGRALAVGAAGLVVGGLVPDDPLVALLEQRAAQLQLAQRALPVCACTGESFL